MPLRRLAPSLLLSLLPMSAGAHPHVFINAALGLDYDIATLSQVTVERQYDDFSSLLSIENLALDPDGDNVLTPGKRRA